MMVPTHQDILDAARRIKGKILRTPFIFSDPLSRQVNIRVYLKLESLQPGGSFKFRGANNAVTMLTPKEREKGVVAASSGNHGTALALAASQVGIKDICPLGREGRDKERTSLRCDKRIELG